MIKSIAQHVPRGVEVFAPKTERTKPSLTMAGEIMRIYHVRLLLLTLFLSGCATAPSADLERAKIEGLPIIVTSVRPSLPNSAGGVDVHIRFVNTSSETIKYARFTVEPYNAVGDIAPSQIGRRTSVQLRETGPIHPGQANGTGYWRNTWYNPSIRCVIITGIEVTYMDDRWNGFVGTDISKVLSSEISNSCAG